MKTKFKILLGMILVFAAASAFSVSAYAATMFSFGAASAVNGEISLPVYLETTDYEYVGGCHFIVEYTDGYTYKGYSTELPGGYADADNSTEHRTSFVWYTGNNNKIENNKLLLGNVTFTAEGKNPEDAVKELALSPVEIIYIDGAADKTGGTMKIADLTGLATYITYDILKDQQDWNNGTIERLYIEDENGATADIEYIFDKDDRYTVVIKLALEPDDDKLIKTITLYADTNTKTGIELKKFDPVVIENMNKKF